MSEISNHSPQRVKHLVELVAGFLEKQNGRQLYEKYEDDIEKVSPMEVVVLFHEVLKLSYPIEEITVAGLVRISNFLYTEKGDPDQQVVGIYEQ